jgi:ElaB/YqjD/DUF883 family membrane-anchored ribosome-binding protein
MKVKARVTAPRMFVDTRRLFCQNETIPKIQSQKEGPMAELFTDKRINEALDLLNDVAKDKRHELSEMISTKYGNLKSMLESYGREYSETYRTSKERIKEGVRDKAKEMDESVHENPWSYIAGVAMVAVLLGFIFGRSR